MVAAAWFLGAVFALVQGLRLDGAGETTAPTERGEVSVLDGAGGTSAPTGRGSAGGFRRIAWRLGLGRLRGSRRRLL